MEARLGDGGRFCYCSARWFPRGVQMGVGASSGRAGRPSALFSVLGELLRSACFPWCAATRDWLLWVTAWLVGGCCIRCGGATMLISAGSGPTPEFSPASCCASWKMEPAPPAAITQPLNISPNGKPLFYEKKAKKFSKSCLIMERLCRDWPTKAWLKFLPTCFRVG